MAASSKGRKPPTVTVRRPPEMPGLDVLDPSATAAFVSGAPKEEAKASTHQVPESSSHQGTEALLAHGMKSSAPLAPESSPQAQPATHAEGELTANEGLEALGTTGTEARNIRAPKHQGTRAPRAPAKGRGLVERAGGKAARRVVAYLDPAIAKKLAIRALHEDTDMSALINEAVRRFMAD